VRRGSGESEEFIKAGVAPTTSLNGMRRSEKAEVLEGMKGLRTSDHTYINTHTSCISRGSGLHIHCGVEVTELSTNKQHSLALIKNVNDWNVCQTRVHTMGVIEKGPR